MILDFLFFLFAGGAVLGGALVITRKNPLSSVVFLVAVFFCLSGMFLMLNAHFVAAINIILYAGAIMVLFVFVIMLLNLGHTTWSDMRGAAAQLISGSTALAFAAVATRALFFEDAPPLAGRGSAELVAASVAEQGVIASVATPLFERYVVPFELTGLLLLVAIIGTIVLARRQAP